MFGEQYPTVARRGTKKPALQCPGGATLIIGPDAHLGLILPSGSCLSRSLFAKERDLCWCVVETVMQGAQIKVSKPLRSPWQVSRDFWLTKECWNKCNSATLACFAAEDHTLFGLRLRLGGKIIKHECIYYRSYMLQRICAENTSSLNLL